MEVHSRVRVVRIGLVLLALVTWQVVGSSSRRAGFLVGSPLATLVELWELIRSGEFFVHAGVTGGEALAGLLLGTIVGTLGGLGLWLSNTLAALMRPVVSALGSFPIFAIAPLMIVWFGVGVEMKIAFASLATVFVAFNQAYSGAHQVSKDYLEMMKGFGAPRWLQFRKVVVPASIDWVLSAFRVNSGLALLGAFLGEFVASNRGLGHLVMRAAGLYNVPKALAGACGIVVLSLVFNWLAGELEKRKAALVQLVSTPRAVRIFAG